MPDTDMSRWSTRTVQERVARELRHAEQRRARSTRVLAVACALAALGVVVVGTAWWGSHASADTTAAKIAGVVAASPSSAGSTPQSATAASPPNAPAPRAAVPPEPAAAPSAAPTPARVRIAIGSAGYEPATVRLSANRPTDVTVGKGEGCAAGFLIPRLGIAHDNARGPVTFRLPPLEAGTYRFTCGMGMVEGRLIVR